MSAPALTGPAADAGARTAADRGTSGPASGSRQRPADHPRPAGTEPPRPGPGYLPAIDGLRAFAIIAVLFYHLGVPFLPGGYLGVDLFFVISGFLITMLLVQEADRTRRVRVGRFWMRRARRLLPALLLMVGVVAATAALVGRDLNAGLRTQVLGATLYGSNWVQIATGTSYVDHYEPQVFTHLWSLAVEEQFYLVWPIVVVVVLALPVRRTGIRAVLILAVVSAAWMAVQYVPGADPTRAYVGTDTHGFALLLGAALGFGSRMTPARSRFGHGRPGRPLNAVGLLGLLGVLAGMLVLNDNGPAAFRGGILIVDIAAVGLVAAAARGSRPVGLIFATPIPIWIGRRSYGIYLWHWPLILIIGRLLPPSAPAWQLVLLTVVTTVLCAELSYRWVEMPIRTHGFGGALRRLGDVVRGRAPVGADLRRVAVASLVTVAVVATVAVAGVVAAPARSTLADQLAAGEAALSEHRHHAAAAGPTVNPTTSADEPAGPIAGAPEVAGTTAPPTRTAPSPVRTTASATKSRSGSGGTSSASSSRPAESRRSSAAPATTAAKPSANPRPSAKPSPTATHSPPPATPVKAAATAARGSVTAIGDSVMLGAAPELFTEFPDIDIDAVASRQWWDLPDIVAGHVSDDQVGRAVIIGLGTNGTWPADQIEAALAPFGQRPVLLVNNYMKRSWSADANAQIVAVATERPHTCVADWQSLAAAKPELIGYDGVHPNADGRRAYADLLVRALRACR